MKKNVSAKKAKKQGAGLGFTIERRGGRGVIVYDDYDGVPGLVRNATPAEVALWEALKKKIKVSIDWPNIDWQRLAIALAGVCADVSGNLTALEAATQELKHDRGPCDCEKPKPWPQLPDYCAVCGGYGLTESED